MLRENLTVRNGLDGGVVVVLVHFTVNGGGLVVVLSTGYVLVLNCWVDCLG